MDLSTWALVVAVAVLTAGALAALLHRVARGREHWLVACLLASGLYTSPCP